MLLPVALEAAEGEEAEDELLLPDENRLVEDLRAADMFCVWLFPWTPEDEPEELELLEPAFELTLVLTSVPESTLGPPRPWSERLPCRRGEMIET